MIGFIGSFIARKAAAFLGSKFSGWVAVFGMLALVATLSAGWFYVAALRADNKRLALAQKQSAAQLESCVKQHVISQEVSRAYQDELSNIDRRMFDLKRVHNGRCIPVLRAAGSDAQTGHGSAE